MYFLLIFVSRPNTNEVNVRYKFVYIVDTLFRFFRISKKKTNKIFKNYTFYEFYMYFIYYT